MAQQPTEVRPHCTDCSYVADDIVDGDRHAAALGHRVALGEDE